MIDIDKLENLPYRKAIKKHDNRGWWDKPWNRGKQYNNKFAWEVVEQILKKYKGKQVNKAFSEYCEIVDVIDQYHFWKEFDKAQNIKRRRGDDYDVNHWFIDKNNNIQYHKAKKAPKTYIIYSADYEIGYMDHMGNTITKAEYVKSAMKYWTTRSSFKDWKEVVIKGERYEFNKKNADFYRCLADENGKRGRMQREYEKYAEKKAYSFLTREEEQKIKDKDIDIIKRDAHGFDEDSFTNNGGRLNE